MYFFYSLFNSLFLIKQGSTKTNLGHVKKPKTKKSSSHWNLKKCKQVIKFYTRTPQTCVKDLKTLTNLL